jgi:hypothetical protein
MNDEYGINKGVPNPMIKKYEVLLRVARAAREYTILADNSDDSPDVWALFHKLVEALKEAERLDLL